MDEVNKGFTSSHAVFDKHLGRVLEVFSPRSIKTRHLVPRKDGAIGVSFRRWLQMVFDCEILDDGVLRLRVDDRS